MPVLGGAVTFSRFRAEHARKVPSDVRRWLARALASNAFEPLDPRHAEEDRAAGFVELEDPDATEFGGVLQGEHALFAWRVDAIQVRAAAVKAEVERWAAAEAAEKGRPPGKREKAERREIVRQMLRQKAEPATKVHDVSWNLESGEVAIWAASRKVVEEAAAAIESAFEVRLQPVTPGAVAARRKVPEKALLPTAELVGVGVEARAEVNRGEA
jgi:recombination associated protein RdgC